MKLMARSKVNPPLTLEVKYKKSIAMIEIRLKNKKEELNDKIKVIELSSLKQNQSSALVPTDTATNLSYYSLQKHLRYIDNLQREFKL